MAKQQPETAIRVQVYQYLSMCPEFFGSVIRNSGMWDPVGKFYRAPSRGMHRGVADIIGVWNGQGLAVEIKTKRGVMSEQQKHWHERWMAKGGLSVVIRSLDEIVDFVKSLRIVGSPYGFVASNTSNSQT